MSVQGTWVNSYGSTMDLIVNDDYINGIYRSSTGSTGAYFVLGYQQPREPTSSEGQAVALAICWHSIESGPADPSWHWASGLSGQLSVQPTGPTLVLAHAMVASDPFPGLAAAGTYIDKLTYTRKADLPVRATAVSVPKGGELRADPLAGIWRSSDGVVMTLEVYPYEDGAVGWIVGKVQTTDGTFEVSGVTDLHASAQGLTLQSVSITALLGRNGPVAAWAGTLDLSNGQLSLLDLSSQSTAPDATYVQTRLSPIVLSRR